MKIIFYLIIICGNIVYAQIGLNKTAQSTMNFLLVGTSSKAGALGEAYTSLGKGSESMFYNPAGLASLNKNFDVNINYTTWIADINYLSGGAAWNLGNYGVIGVNLLTVDYGVINGTSLVPLAEQNNHPIGYIDNGQVGNIGAYSFGLSYAKAINDRFSIGGTVKLVGQNLGNSLLSTGVKENNASKVAFDAGIKYLTGFRSFMFGMSIRNFASNIRREEIDEQLPLVFSLGAAMNVMDMFEMNSNDPLYLAVDFLHQNNYSERVNLGLEYRFMDMLALRGGYQTNRDLASWTGGIGFFTSFADYDVEINYSYSAFEVFNNVNRFTLVFTF